MDVISELAKLGFNIIYESPYEGSGGDRKRVEDRSRVYSVVFPLSAEEWCDLCMRDGDSYMGGCCGQTGAIQDHFNSIFRDSGVASNRDILDLMQTASRHEGFEEYAMDWSGDLAALIRSWDEHGPVRKIGICCQAVKSKLSPKGYRVPMEQESEDWCHILEGGLRLLRFRDLCLRDGDKSQQHANREELLARILPACKKVMEETIPALSKAFSGYAIVKAQTVEVQADSFGLCIYASEKIARAKLDLWKQAASESETAAYLGKLEIKPVTIDAQAGMVWK